MTVKILTNIRRKSLQTVFLLVFILGSILPIHSYEKIVRTELNERPTLMTGNYCVWDFSNMIQKAPKQTIRYLMQKDTLSVFSNNNICKYKNTPNGLLLVSTENPKNIQTYPTSQPMIIPFGLQLGDSIVSVYQSIGEYCDDYTMKSRGTIVVKCIGRGKLKDCHNGILDNVLLFYRNDISFVCASPKNELKGNLNISNIKKEEKTYFWMVPNTHNILYQYSIQEFSLGKTQLSRKCVFHKYEYEAIRGEEDKGESQEILRSPLTFRIQNIEIKNRKLLVEYECTESGDVKIQVCNVAGITYKSKSYLKNDIQQSGSLSISLSNLSRGTYIANIYFKGNIYKKTFNL